MILRVLTINAKDGTLSIAHLDKPDASTASHEEILKYDQNLAFRTGIAALKVHKQSNGEDNPQVFAAAGSEYYYNDKTSLGNMKQVFDNTKAVMPLFPFAATSQVRSGSNSGLGSTGSSYTEELLVALSLTVHVYLDSFYGRPAPPA
jgi:hypothetical protein